MMLTSTRALCKKRHNMSQTPGYSFIRECKYNQKELRVKFSGSGVRVKKFCPTIQLSAIPIHDTHTETINRLTAPVDEINTTLLCTQLRIRKNTVLQSIHP